MDIRFSEASALPTVAQLLPILQNGPIFRLFSVFFTQALQFLKQCNVKKCPSSIQCMDSNRRPLDRKSPPFTTRSGLPPYFYQSYLPNPRFATLSRSFSSFSLIESPLFVLIICCVSIPSHPSLCVHLSVVL